MGSYNEGMEAGGPSLRDRDAQLVPAAPRRASSASGCRARPLALRVRMRLRRLLMPAHPAGLSAHLLPPDLPDQGDQPLQDADGYGRLLVEQL